VQPTTSPAPGVPRTSTRARTRRRRAVAGLLAVLVVAATACIPPDDLSVTTVASNLVSPWDVAFLPDGTMLATEKDGKIDAWVGGTKRVLADPADSIISGEGGMMGLAVDGQFTSNRYIYTCFVSTLPAGTANDVRVARWRVSDDLTTLTNRTDIITGIPYSTGRHSGCRPRFGPDGYLWVGTGDAAVGTHPQNPLSLGGKVLRVNRDGGGAPGNPGGAFLPQIYTYGHRNVQGIAFRPSDGAAFSVEHGTGCDDEVNQLVAGGNYGWDPVPGYDESRPMTDLTKFPNARTAYWSSGCPTIAPSGAAFIDGPGTWNGWNNQLVMAVLKGTEIRVIGRYSTGSYDQVWVDVEDQGRLRSAVMGPDGNLYLTQDANPGKILKVTPVNL
jgi:glucose/arabinose dehydrogenase